MQLKCPLQISQIQKATSFTHLGGRFYLIGMQPEDGFGVNIELVAYFFRCKFSNRKIAMQSGGSVPNA